MLGVGSWALVKVMGVEKRKNRGRIGNEDQFYPLREDS